MLVEKMLKNFQSMSLEEKITELQKYNELVAKGYLNISEDVLKLMESIINNELVDKEISCSNGVCEIKNIVSESNKNNGNIIEIDGDVIDLENFDVKEKVDDLIMRKLIYFVLSPYFDNVSDVLNVKFDDDKLDVVIRTLNSKILNSFKTLYNEFLFVNKKGSGKEILFSPYYIDENDNKVENEINPAFVNFIKRMFDDVFNGEVDFNKTVKFKINKIVYQRIVNIFKKHNIEYDDFHVNTSFENLLKIPYFAIIFSMVLYYYLKRRRIASIEKLKFNPSVYMNNELDENIFKIGALKKIILYYDKIFVKLMNEKSDIIKYVKEHFSSSIDMIEDIEQRLKEKKIGDIDNDFKETYIEPIVVDIVSSNKDINFNKFIVELKRRFYENLDENDEEVIQKFEKMLNYKNDLRDYYEEYMQKAYLIYVFNERFENVFGSDTLFNSIENYKKIFILLKNILDKCRSKTGIHGNKLNSIISKIDRIISDIDELMKTNSVFSIVTLFEYLLTKSKGSFIDKLYLIIKNDKKESNKIKLIGENSKYAYLNIINGEKIECDVRGSNALKIKIGDVNRLIDAIFNDNINKMKQVSVFEKLYDFMLNDNSYFPNSDCVKKFSVECLSKRSKLLFTLLSYDEEQLKNLIHKYNEDSNKNSNEILDVDYVIKNWNIIIKEIKIIINDAKKGSGSAFSGEGPYERFIQLVYPEVKISGGSVSFDVFYKGNPYEVKKVESSGTIRLGKEGMIGRFPELVEFIRLVYDILNYIDDIKIMKALKEKIEEMNDSEADELYAILEKIRNEFNSIHGKAEGTLKTKLEELELNGATLEVFKDLLENDLNEAIDKIQKYIGINEKYIGADNKIIKIECSNNNVCECKMIDKDEYGVLSELDYFLIKLKKFVGNKKLNEKFNEIISDIEGYLSTSFKRHPLIIWKDGSNDGNNNGNEDGKKSKSTDGATVVADVNSNDGFIRKIKFVGISQNKISITYDKNETIDVKII